LSFVRHLADGFCPKDSCGVISAKKNINFKNKIQNIGSFLLNEFEIWQEILLKNTGKSMQIKKGLTVSNL